VRLAADRMQLGNAESDAAGRLLIRARARARARDICAARRTRGVTIRITVFVAAAVGTIYV
jgi:hypothetical protein